MTRLPLDDLLVEDVASHNVDYLSFHWKPEDLWSTRRYLRLRKTQLERYWRLENAMWRSWAKQARRLPCSPARSIQWDKDTDITWLYGPWKSASFGPSAYQLRPGQFTCIPSSIRAQEPRQNKLGTSVHQGILLAPDPRLSSGLTQRKFGTPHTGKQSRRVRFSQKVQQCLYLPQDIHWETIFCHQIYNQNSFWPEENFHDLYLLFKVQKLRRSVLPLPPAPLKPIDNRSSHSSSLGAIFYFEGRK